MIRFLIFCFFFFCSASLWAQAPGGVGGAGDLVGWFRADQGTSTTIDDDDLQTWTDQAIGTNNAVQNTGANQPVFNNDTSNINFNPYITFDNTNDYLVIPDNGDYDNNVNTEQTYSVAFRTSNDVTARQVIFEEGGGTRGFNVYIFDGDLYCAAWDRSDDDGGGPDAAWGPFFGSTAIAENTEYIFTYIHEGNNAPTGNFRCYLNGSEFINQNNIGRMDGHNGAVIGAKDRGTRFETGNSGGQGQSLIGDISELTYYNDIALTATERQRVESYLAIKYGITLLYSSVADYLDSTGATVFPSLGTHSAYSNDIAGIAVDNGSDLDQQQSQSVNTDSIVEVSNPSAIADGEFFMWGNDNDDDGSIDEVTTEVPVTVSRRLDREWRVAETGDVGTVDLEIDINSLTVTGTTAADFALLVDDTDSDFSSGVVIVPATSLVGGILLFDNINLDDDDYFTLATQYTPTPPSVTLSANNLSVPENSGTSDITVTLSNTWTSDVTVTLSLSGVAGHVTDYALTTTIVVTSGNLSNSETLTPVNDGFSEGSESVIIDINSVTNGTEDGVQQVTLQITDDEPANNACGGTERIFTTELTSGDVNSYDLSGTPTGSFTSPNNFNYETVVDPDNLFIYLSSFDDLSIDRMNLDGTGYTQLFSTTVTPFQIDIHQDVVPSSQNKLFWSDWSANATIHCANLDGTGTPVAIATGLFFPTGMSIDKNTNNIYVNFGVDSPRRIDRYSNVLNPDGTCNPTPTLTNIITGGALPLNFNMTIDPPGNRLFYGDFSLNNIVKINTDGTGLDLTLWAGTAPGDSIRDIVYNKNTDELYWVNVNGVVQRANADGTGSISTVVTLANAQGDSRSIDICVDDTPPRLVQLVSTSSDGTYCPSSTINITALYDETVVAGSTLTIVLDNGESVVLNNISGNEISGTYTVGATGSGQDSSDLTVASISSESVTDANGNTRVNSTVPAAPNNIADTSAIVVDTTGPALVETGAVPDPTTDNTPDYTFTSDEAGPLTMGGSCDTATTTVSSGSNTITLDSNGAGGALADGTYNDCTISVPDAVCGNVSTLNISSFQVAATVPDVTLGSTVTISETGGSTIITATLSNTYGAAVTVNLAFGGTATNIDDYTRSNTQIVIPALSTSGTITINAVSDTLDEADETVIVSISSVTNGNDASSPATVTITDDDPLPTVNISLDQSSIDESGSDGSATFTFTLNTVSGRDITLTLSTVGSDAVGADYNSTPGSFTSFVISEGNLSDTLVIAPVDDTLYENDEDLVITISAADFANIGSNTETTTIVEDILCNQSPPATPAGYTNYITASIETTIGSSDPTPDGDFFDAYVNSLSPYTRSTDELKDEAVDFFLAEYGIDFSGGDISADGNFALLHLSYSTEGLAAPNDVSLDATVHSANGSELSNAGTELHAGIYTAIKLTMAPSMLTGSWGGAGKFVPFGTVVEYGEYLLKFNTVCSDGAGENYLSSSAGSNAVDISDLKLLAFQSRQPTLADFDSPSPFHPSGVWLEKPQFFEHDIIAPSLNVGGSALAGDYAITNGEIRGVIERRDTDTLATMVITE